MINTVIFCCLSFAITCLGFWIFINNFPERRWKAKWAGAVFWIVFLVACAIQAWDAQHAFVSYLQVILYSLINTTIIYMFFVCNLKEALIWECFYAITLAIIKVPVLTIRGIVSGGNLLMNVNKERIWEENLWCFIIILIIGVSYIRWEREISRILKRILQNNKVILFLLVVFEYILLVKMIELGSHNFKMRAFVYDIFVIFTVTICCLVLNIYYLYRDSQKEQLNLHIQKERLIKEQRVTKEYYEKEARHVHDIKHELLYLQKCIKDNELDKAEVYLEQSLQNLKEFQRKVWTGISEIDFVVNYEYQKMQQKGIKFTLSTDVYEIPIDGTGFMVVLGNLLDNAVEAAEKCIVGSRFIKLKMKSINNMFMLSIENSYNTELKIHKRHVITTKENYVWHGWGVKNVEQIVQKQGGDFEYRYIEGQFVVNINFYERRK